MDRFTILLIFSTLVTSASSFSIPFKLELRQVQVLARHGFRAPAYPYPNDPYKNESKYWPKGWGQLTLQGEKQQFELGKFFRKRYGSLISSDYFSSEVFATSSDYDRTILSAQLALAGMYDFGNGTIGLGSFVPVHTISKSVDRMIYPRPQCPRRKAVYEEFSRSNLSVNFYKKHEGLYKELGEKMGYEAGSIGEVSNSAGSLFIQRLSNLSLPNWANEFLDNKVKTDVIESGFAFFTGTESLKRLTAGPLLADIVEHMNKFISTKDSRKFRLYSGHDINIANILNTFDAFRPHQPAFSSALFFDLFEETSRKEYFIQISYKNTTTGEDVYEVQLPKCPSPCTLLKFMDEYRYYLPTSEELDTECQLDILPSSSLTA